MKFFNKNQAQKFKKFINDRVDWKTVGRKSMTGIMKVGAAVGNNRFLVGIRDSFMVPFAVMLGSSIPLIFSLLFFKADSVITNIPGVKGSEGMKWVDYIIGFPFWQLWGASMTGFSLYICVGLGYFFSISYGKDGIIGAALAIGAFFILGPLANVNQREAVNHVWVVTSVSTNYLGLSGLIVAILSSLLSTFLYVKLMEVRWLIIKLPSSIPVFIARSFSAVFVAAIILVIFALIGQFWWIIVTQPGGGWYVSYKTLKGDPPMPISVGRQISTIFAAIEFSLASPLQTIGTNIGTTIAISFLVAFFWFFGINGTNIMSVVTIIVWDKLVYQNFSYYIVWKDLPSHIHSDGVDADYWTQPLMVPGYGLMNGLSVVPMAGMGYIGGTGCLLGFTMDILVFSKYKYHREIAKLNVGPSWFGIGEPMIFGIPLVLNPLYFVPFVFSFTILYTLGHVYMLEHWMRPAVIMNPPVPWGISIIWATDFQPISILFVVIQFVLACLFWLPFVWIGPKYAEKMNAAAAEKAKREQAEVEAAAAANVALEDARELAKEQKKLEKK